MVQALRVWGIARTVLYVCRLITGMCCRKRILPVIVIAWRHERYAPLSPGVVAFLFPGRAGPGVVRLYHRPQLVTGDLLLRGLKLWVKFGTASCPFLVFKFCSGFDPSFFSVPGSANCLRDCLVVPPTRRVSLLG